MTEISRTYIDRGLELAAKHREYLMYAREVPPTMVAAFDYAAIVDRPARMQLRQPGATTDVRRLIGPADTAWQPVDGTVTAADIRALEQQLGVRLPPSYQAYLQYRHYLTIFWHLDIRLYPKPAGQWQQVLLNENKALRPVGLDRGYLAIGDFSDYGSICLDQRQGPTEPRVLRLDHETGETDGVLAENFPALLMAALALPEPTLESLKPWQKA